MTRRFTLPLLLVVALSSGSVPAVAQPAEIELIRLVDSQTLVPGTGDGDTFFLDSRDPSPCDLGVVFIGNRRSDFGTGIYAADGPGDVRVIVDESTPLPDGTGNLQNFRNVYCSGSRVVFTSRDNAPTEPGQGDPLGLYEWTDGSLRLIVDRSSYVESIDGRLQGISQPRISGSRLVFSGSPFGGDISGIYVENPDGTIEPAIDSTRFVPEIGGPIIAVFGSDTGPSPGSEIVTSITYADGSATFSRKALLAVDGDQIRVVASSVTPVPGSPIAEFVNVTPGAIWEDQILFGAATSESGPALYLEQGGLLEVLLPHATPLPGSNSVEAVIDVDTDRGVHGFIEGQNAPYERVFYLLIDGTIVRVLGNGDTLDGQVVSDIRFALEDGQLAVWVLFNDHSQAIYAASLIDAAPPLDVPGPGGLGLGLLALLLAGSGTLWLRRS